MNDSKKVDINLPSETLGAIQLLSTIVVVNK